MPQDSAASLIDSTMFKLRLSRSSKVLSSVILPNSDRIVVCANCTNAKTASETCDSSDVRSLSTKPGETYPVRGTIWVGNLNVEDSVDLDCYIVSSNGRLVGNGYCFFLQVVYVCNTVYNWDQKVQSWLKSLVEFSETLNNPCRLLRDYTDTLQRE